jgi:hypothetical protein
MTYLKADDITIQSNDGAVAIRMKTMSGRHDLLFMMIGGGE